MITDLHKNLGRVLILLAASLFSTSAFAATVIGKLDSVGSGDSVTVHMILPNGQPLAEQVLLGMDSFTRTGGTDTSSLIGGPNGFLAFCLEPFEEARINNTYTYNVDLLSSAASSSMSGGIGAIRAIQIGELFGQFAPTLSASMSALQASALQVAIWEIVGEPINSVFNLASGNMFFTTPASSDFNNVISLAQSYLTYVSNANGNGVQAQGLRALTNNGSQDMLVQVVSAAPEPGTWMMLVIGFGLTGAAMRKRRHSHDSVVAYA